MKNIVKLVLSGNLPRGKLHELLDIIIIFININLVCIWFTSLHVWLFICLCLPVYLSSCQRVYLSSCSPVYLSTRSPVYLSTCSLIYVSTYLAVCLCTCLWIFLSTWQNFLFALIPDYLITICYLAYLYTLHHSYFSTC